MRAVRQSSTPAKRAAAGSSCLTEPLLQAVTAVNRDEARFLKQVSGTSKASAPSITKRMVG